MKRGRKKKSRCTSPADTSTVSPKKEKSRRSKKPASLGLKAPPKKGKNDRTLGKGKKNSLRREKGKKKVCARGVIQRKKRWTF